MSNPTEYTLTTGDVARQLGRSIDTVARYADLGLIKCQRAPLDRGHRMFRQVDVDAYTATLSKETI